MWFSDRYRRHLCDMHIDDWDERFFSEYSPEMYVEALKTAHINDAMIYLQAHTGLCYYPTKVGVMHRAFRGRENMIRRTIDLCHENDIKVMGYYSLIYNTAEHDRHPDWRMLRADGRSGRDRSADELAQLNDVSKFRGVRYGLCCLNNPDYTEFTLRQIDEMDEYFALDGLFYDMPFWPHICYCDACVKRYRAENGVDLPREKPQGGTPEYELLSATYYRWMGEWIQMISDYTRSKNPHYAIEFNFASAIAGNSLNGCGEEVNAASDYSGGDLYGGIVNQSLTCKFYKNITKNQPFEYMFTRAKPGLASHTLTKTQDEMNTSVAVTASHHGATFVIDAIDPVGTLDMRVYKRVGKMFDFQMPYEPYFRGEMEEDIGIYYGIRSRVDPVAESRSSTKSCLALSTSLIAQHIPFGITGSFHRLDGYKAIFAPWLSNLEAGDNARLCDYVRNGGTLYLSGGGNRELIRELTGGTVTGYHAETKPYVAPKEAYLDCFGGFCAKYPLPFSGRAAIIEGVAEEYVAATLTYPYTGVRDIRYASIHSNPPGDPTDIPAVVVCPYGRGHVIWSALPLECGDTEEYGEILWSLLSRVGSISELSFRSDAPGHVELTLFSYENEKTLNCTVLTDAAHSYPVSPFRVSVKCDTAPKRITVVGKDVTIPFTYADGYATFTTETLRIYDLYRIEL
ncbi:MAG: hypothetical protein J6B77_02575 [Clostridia bacterium]|nr:hypothetical protein [Clostridia bacterium]